MKKRKGKPAGMTYADVLTRKKAVAAGIEKAATDAALQIETDTRVQRAMWLMVVSMADAFGIGPGRSQKFFEALQANSDLLMKMTAEADEDYAYEKLRQRAEQITGIKIEYLYEHEALAAQLKHAREGVQFE